MNRIILSLTSYPSRIQYITPVLLSLSNQTIQANEIILWLSKEQFEKEEYKLAEDIISFCSSKDIHIRWVDDDLGPHKKYYYALKEYYDDTVITVDDDRVYSKEMVRELVNAHGCYNDVVIARRVRTVFRKDEEFEDYKLWLRGYKNRVGRPSFDLCPIGVAGVLYPPKCSDDEWFNKEKIFALVGKQDDLWLKIQEIRNGLPVCYVEGESADTDLNEAWSSGALMRLNVDGGKNNHSLKQLKDYYIKRSWFKNWFHSLHSIDEFVFQRKKYYRECVTNMMTKHKVKNVYICGAGKYARLLDDFLNVGFRNSIVYGFLVTDVNSNPRNERVFSIDAYRTSGAFIALCGVGKRYEDEMRKAIQETKGIWMELDLQEIADIQSTIANTR